MKGPMQSKPWAKHKIPVDLLKSAERGVKQTRIKTVTPPTGGSLVHSGGIYQRQRRATFPTASTCTHILLSHRVRVTLL